MSISLSFVLDNLSQSQNDVVLQKLTQILSYIRTGNKKKKGSKKLDYDLEKMSDEEEPEVKTEPKDDGFNIFSDEEVEQKDEKRKKSKKSKNRRRSRSKSPERKERSRKERKRSRDRSRSAERSKRRDEKDRKRRKDSDTSSRKRSSDDGKIKTDFKTERASDKPKYFDDIERVSHFK